MNIMAKYPVQCVSSIYIGNRYTYTNVKMEIIAHMFSEAIHLIFFLFFNERVHCGEVFKPIFDSVS